MASIAGVVLVLAIIFLGSGCAGLDGVAEPVTAERRGDKQSATESPVAAPAETTTVTWVLDGDTFRVLPAAGQDSESEETVRLLGINAPEKDECGGTESLDYAIDLLGRQEITLERHGFDEFGRTIAAAWLDGQFVNRTLVVEGHAVARAAFDHPYEDELNQAEATAQDRLLGLWSSGCRDSSTGVSIVAVQADAPGRDDENPNGEWILIKNSSQTLIALGGWSLRDESTRHRFRFPDGIRVLPDAQVEIRSGCVEDDDLTTAPDHLVLHWCDPDGPVWSNGGDTAFLLTPAGAIADSLSWESVYTDQ